MHSKLFAQALVLAFVGAVTAAPVSPREAPSANKELPDPVVSILHRSERAIEGELPDPLVSILRRTS
jgi:hypothetical protein